MTGSRHFARENERRTREALKAIKQTSQAQKAASRANGFKPTHGHFVGDKPSPTYSSWDGMMSRCYRKSSGTYPQYGGSGIVVCERWHTFANFLADMGERPSREHSIERVDGARNYEPTNCRWATRKEQSRNRRSNLRLTLNGETLTAIEWSERLGISYHMIYTRKGRGWSDERTLTAPRKRYPERIVRRQ